MDVKRFNIRAGVSFQGISYLNEYENAKGEWVKYEDIKRLLNVPKAEQLPAAESYPKLSDVPPDIVKLLLDINSAYHGIGDWEGTGENIEPLIGDLRDLLKKYNIKWRDFR